MLTLREWLSQNHVYLDQRLSINSNPSLRLVANSSIHSKETVASIPKSLVLSRRTSTVCRLIPDSPSPLKHLASTVQLSIHVLYELQLGDRSRWKGYFDHCPKETVDIGLLWEEEGNSRNWVRGTQLEREMLRIGVTRTSLSNIFNSLVLPLFSSLPSTSSITLTPPRIDDFYHAYSLVSSRAFQVDTYHQLALVPLADAFNHSSPNHVHFASDTWVCEECGKLDECPHDDSIDQREAKRVGHEDGQTCDMVTTEEGVVEGEEVFNSYGSLSNARLIAEYGFALEANEWDTITFEEQEIHDLLARHEPLPVDSNGPVRSNEFEEEHLLIAPRSSQLSRSLHFDADARISDALWSTIALSVLQRYRRSSEKGRIDSARLDELAQTLASLVSEEEEEEEEKGPSGRDSGVDEMDLATLEDIARVVLELCLRRVREQTRPELSGTQLLDLAETVQDKREKLAIEFTAGERLLLERVRENWIPFARERSR